MRRYETIVIVDPDLGDDGRTSLFNRIKEIIPQQEGVLIDEDLWGARKLAYEIKKKQRGYYARYDYCGMGPVVDEIERFFRIDDRVLKYMTVQLAEEADADEILAEMAAQKATDTPESDSTEKTSELQAAPPEKAEEPSMTEPTEAVQPATGIDEKE